MCIHDISQNLFQAENFVTQNWWEVQSKNYIILNSYPAPFSGHNKTINRYLKRKIRCKIYHNIYILKIFTYVNKNYPLGGLKTKRSNLSF